MTGKVSAPKPLVQVWRAEPGKWLYDCRRCHEQLFERTTESGSHGRGER